MLQELVCFELSECAVASLQRKDHSKLSYLQTILVSSQVLFWVRQMFYEITL